MKKLIEEQHKNKLRQLIFDNKNIEAIKYIRNLTGLGLKESKDLCDTFCYDLAKLDDFNLEIKEEEVITNTVFQNSELSENDLNLVKKLLQLGQKLNAVKYVKKSLNIGLKEAKEIVDALEDGPQKTETVIFGEDESIMVETDVENESYIEFGATDEPDSGTETDLTENFFIQKEELVRKKSSRKKESQPFTFEKTTERDKKKKRTRSNSGCMLMLTFMFFTSLIIAGGIYLFFKIT